MKRAAKASHARVEPLPALNEKSIPTARLAPARYGSAALLIIAALSAVFALYFGKELLLPLAFALVLRLLLAPAQRVLTEQAHLPAWSAAIVLVLALFAAVLLLAAAVSVPGSRWLQKAPETLPVLREKIAVLRQPLDYLQEHLHELESAATAPRRDGLTEPAITVKPPSAIAVNLASRTATSLARFFTTMVLLFFLLSAGDRLLRAFVEVLPRYSEKRQTVEIAGEIEHHMTRYLLLVTVMNAIVGGATGATMWAFGFGDPILWGTAAFLLNYVPILGPLTGVLMFFAVGILTFDSPWTAVFPAGAYLLIHVAEGELITPMLIADRLTINPVLVVTAVFFWYALWGIPGALLAVPLLAIFKIFCDRVDPLKPVGHIIGA
jgi:predicted PurR-regulated permease PerM